MKKSSLTSPYELPINGSPLYDDLRFPATSVKVTSTNPPGEQSYKGGLVLAFSDTSDNIVYFNAQFPHKRKRYTDLGPHIHIVLPTAGAGAGVENMKFDLTYSWAGVNSEFPAETTISFTEDVQTYSANTHKIIGFPDISKDAIAGVDNVSSMMICSLKRDTSVANNYTDDVYLLEADIHYEVDSLGSREIFNKV